MVTIFLLECYKYNFGGALQSDGAQWALRKWHVQEFWKKREAWYKYFVDLRDFEANSSWLIPKMHIFRSGYAKNVSIALLPENEISQKCVN